MSVGIEEAILLTTAEDIKLHACLLAQIVVDTYGFNLTILQWSQIYMIPTSWQLRELDCLAKVKFCCILTSFWHFRDNHCKCINHQLQVTICQYSDIDSVDTIYFISIFIPRQINHTCGDRIHTIEITIHSNGTVNSYQCRT